MLRLRWSKPLLRLGGMLAMGFIGTLLGLPLAAQAQTSLSNGVPVNNLGGTQGSQLQFKINVPAGATNLRFTTSGGSGGDVDIFAKFNAMPTISVYDAKGDGPTRNESITLATPKTGTYYLLLNGAWSTYAGVQLIASYDAPVAATLHNGVAVNNLSGTEGSMLRFQLSVPDGARNLRFSTSGGSGGDVDIFVKLNALPTVSFYDAKSDGPTRNDSITLAAPQAGTYNLLLYGPWSTYTGVTLLASFDTANSCALASSTVVPAIATKAAWDAQYDQTFGNTTIPGPLNGGNDYAWHGHYWVRAYVSMAKTYGDTKYLDRAVRMIDYWFQHSDTPQGWSSGAVNDPDEPSYTMLNTGLVAQAISIFSYSVWNDNRFTAYRAKADSYLARLEPMLHTYDWQWVDKVTDYQGAPSFWRYATCGGLCPRSSLIMYNQGATMAKALLMIDRTYRLKGVAPNADYLRKADAAAAYFKTFVRQQGNAYVWNYGGARPQPGVQTEDTNHGHVDLSLVIWARKFGLGGLTDVDMHNLAGTMQVVLNQGATSYNNVWKFIDGSVSPKDNWDRVPVGIDWIELADFDPTLFDKVVKVYNRFPSPPEGSRFYLGWAEIQRKKSCTAL